MSQTPQSPKIRHLSWGQIRVEGFRKVFKDVKLFPGGARSWDWNETGTRHIPGIQTDDVKELVAKGARIVILSQGMNQRLQVTPETLAYLEGHKVTAYILETKAAVERYNQLAEKELVGGLFHSTC